MRKAKRPLRYPPTSPVSLRAWRNHPRPVALLLLTAFALTAYLMASPPPSQAQLTPSQDIVISQVYAGGGLSSSSFSHDFVELYNRGSLSVDIAGWSLQVFNSSTG
ncbi:MAG TPA: lamin tail domain-containing protein, partial [Pyrinomonadaceae bacterium]|nr:lamin tail domain-containing protein [Pyrinomonadaceae bacterium]